MDIYGMIAKEFSLTEAITKAIIELIDAGNTLPFIARYRKEQTGGIDDQVLRELYDRVNYLRALQKRKDEVKASIEEQGKLTEDIEKALAAAVTLAVVEDIYRPYKKKRATRASMAKERGLEPLAVAIFEGADNIEALADSLIDEEKGVPDREAAIKGALDILAENFSDNAELRSLLRADLWKKAVLKSTAKKEEDSVYALYYDFAEAIRTLPSHRILAINRGEKEDFLKASLTLPDDSQKIICEKSAALAAKRYKSLIEEALTDAYDRLIFPALEREIRSDLTDRASEAAIKNFAKNLNQLLLQPPIKGAVVIGLDPGYRTGCKVAVVDSLGRVLDTSVIYITHSENQKKQAAETLSRFIKKHGATVIAIGNGTASRETESFAAEVLREHPGCAYVIVSEAGASVYSASKLAAEEFPEFDLTLRSAVSIARRLQDPLAELCKIDPKAIGVGQYQHDMPPARLSEALGGVVEDCVNGVGVDVNTASASLLSYVSGIGPALAKNIAAYREENGAFTTRRELLKVAKLGKKAYEQCAGFLRIREGKNPLDNTGVHPESYDAAKALLARYGAEKALKKGAVDLFSEVENEGIRKVSEELSLGVPTLTDILKELAKPGRDPRDELPAPILRTDVLTLSDLKEGMELVGTVRNVIDFGAFVDIGVHEDGLVHISQICDRFIKHPSDVLKVGDIVKVKVISVDIPKKRIGLTMKL